MMLDERMPGRVEVINAGVIGYSSHQGLTRLRTEVAEWSPDLVTVYFRWNYHWLARKYSDRDQPIQVTLPDRLHSAMDNLRIYQLLVFAMPRRTPAPLEIHYHVSMEDYAENLRKMKRTCDDLGAKIWFITAPHVFDPGIPRYLRTSGEVADIAGLVELHEHYNEQVRAVAKESSTIVNERGQRRRRPASYPLAWRPSVKHPLFRVRVRTCESAVATPREIRGHRFDFDRLGTVRI
jgi:hypothetical protein